MYLPQLDFFRFILFIYILIAHSFVDLDVIYHHPWIVGFYRTGWIGVQGFFVLSGFIITQILLREINTQGGISFKRFYVRRVLKIVPPFYLAVVAILLLSQIDFFSSSAVWNHLPADPDAFMQSIKELPYFLLFSGNIPLAFGEIEKTTPAILINWTLAIEEQFYLIQPIFLAWAFSKKTSPARIMQLLWGMVLVSLTIRCGTAYLYEENFYRNFNNTFTLTQFDSICIGVIIALGQQHHGGWISALRKKMASVSALYSLATLGILLVGLSWMINQSVLMTYTLGLTLINMFFGLCILLMVSHPAAQIAPNAISRLGRNGYCLYLTHHIALIIAYEVLPPTLASVISAPTLYWLRLLCALLLSISLAWALYLASEAPFEKLRQHLRTPQKTEKHHQSS